MSKNIKVGWEEAILKVFKNKNGIVTLQDLYKQIPSLIGETSSEDVNHTIRAFLRRLKQSKKLIKQIGLSTYALTEIDYPNHFYERIKVSKKDFFRDIPKEQLHGYIEGIIIELGNFHNYDTYTADRNVAFNGKYLEELVTYGTIPNFTYSDIIDRIKQIDVIWFKDGFPAKTFDVENSTDFSKALNTSFPPDS